MLFRSEREAFYTQKESLRKEIEATWTHVQRFKNTYLEPLSARYFSSNSSEEDLFLIFQRSCDEMNRRYERLVAFTSKIPLLKDNITSMQSKLAEIVNNKRTIEEVFSSNKRQKTE